MDIRLINIGFGNIVAANRIVAIVSPESAPIKRIIQESRDRGRLIDATYGRRTRAVIITDSEHVILSSVQPETVANRLGSRDSAESSASGASKLGSGEVIHDLVDVRGEMAAQAGAARQLGIAGGNAGGYPADQHWVR